MGIVKCAECGSFIHEDEVVWVQKDDTHDIPYCVECSPEQDDLTPDEG